MTVLSDAERADIAAEYQRDLSNEREQCSFSKVELRAAVDAADTWVNTNAAAFNAALPAAFRTAATAAQKARLLDRIVRRRFIDGV